MQKKNFNTDGKTAGERAIEKFTEMMIQRMEELKAGHWEKGWIGGTVNGIPQNVSGRHYNGSNTFFLQLISAEKGYKMPVFMTFKQAQDNKAHVLKGEHSMPVVYWDVIVKDENGKKVDYDEFKLMSKEDREKMSVVPFLKAFPVYNIAQTNFAEAQPEKYEKLKEQFKAPDMRDTNGMYSNKAMDMLIEKQEWVCPIQADKMSESAYYSPSRDVIVLPMKSQFAIHSAPDNYADGMEFYGTALHEMAHSTGAESRLNREKGAKFGEPKYAKEELIAELTSAMIGSTMGFDQKINDNNAKYLNSWIEVLKKEPKFIVSVMADVNKAADMIFDRLDKMKLKLNEPVYLEKNNILTDGTGIVDVPFKNTNIIKQRNGEYAIRASYNGEDLGIKPISKETAKTFFSLKDDKEKSAFLSMTARKHFNVGESRSLKTSRAM